MNSEPEKSEIYFVDKKWFREAMMTFAFKTKVKWDEEGLSLLSWHYHKVAEVNDVDPNLIYKKMKRWKGNKKSKKAGHRTISIGDIVVVGTNVRLVTGCGWALVPRCIWKKVIKN